MAVGFNPFDQGLSQEETQQRKVFNGAESDGGAPRTPQDTFNPFSQGNSKLDAPDPTGVPESSAAQKGFNPFTQGDSNLDDSEYRQLYAKQKAQGLGDIAHGAWEGVKSLGNMATGSAKEIGQSYGDIEASAEQNPLTFQQSEGARRLRASVLEGAAQTGRNYLNMVTKDVPDVQDLATAAVSGGPGALLSAQVQHEINKPGGMVRNLLKKVGIINPTPEQEETEYQSWKSAQQNKEELQKTPAAPAALQQLVSGGAEPLPETTAAVSMAADPLNYASLGASPIAQAARKVEAGVKTASAAENAARMAGNVMTKGGKTLEAIGSLPEKAAEKIAEVTLGPGAAESVQKATGVIGSAAKLAGAHALAGPLEPVVVGLEAAKRAGQISGKAGEVTTALADADRTNPFGRIAAIAKDPDSPEWLRYAASSPLVKGAANVAGAAKDVAAGALHGTAVGAALGSANADTPEELGESAGQMGAFGAGARALTLPAQNRARVMQKMADSAAELYHQNVSAGTTPETLKKVGDSTMMNAAAAQKMFGDVNVRFLDGESGQFAEQATKSNASTQSAGFWDPTDRTIYLNADSGRGVDTTLLHELTHPLFDSVVANRPELKAQIDSSLQRTGKTLDQAKQDYVQQIVGEKGFTNRDDFDRAVNQYIDRMDKASAATNNDPNHWIYSELMAEAGMKAMKGKNLVTDIADPTLSTRAVRATKGLLEGLGVKFKEGQDGKTILPNFEDTITSPELRKSTYSLLRSMKDYRPGIDEPEPQGVKVTPETLGQHPGAPVHVLPNGELGNDFMSQSASGQAAARPNRDIRKIVKNRRAEVNAAYPLPQTEAPSTQDPKLQWRKTPSGLQERTGITLGPDFDKLRTFSDDTKAKAHDLEGAIANGEARQGWYQQIGEGPDWKGSVSRDTGNVSAQHKQFLPINFHVDKAGNVLVRNYSLGAFNDKAQMWSGRHGPLSLDLWEGNVGEFKTDVAKYLDNHKQGLSGDTGIGDAKKNVINAFLVGKNVTWEKANPLRSAMRGHDAQGVVRSYRLDRLETLAPHETEFTTPDYAKQVKNLSPDLKRPIEVTGPDGKKYKATYDGDQDFSAIGRGKVPQITMLDEAPGFTKHTTTYGPSLEKKGYKFELPKDEEAKPAEAPSQSPDDKYKLKEGSGMFSKAWILPDGKPVQLGGQWHHEWINENPDVAKKYGLKTTDSSEDNRVDALRKGFVRVNYEKNTGTLKVEARQKDWPNVKESVRKMVETNLGKIDNMDVHLLDRRANKIVDQDGVKLFTYPTEEKMDNLPFISTPGETTSMSAQASSEPSMSPDVRKPNEDVRKMANSYAKDAGIDYTPHTGYAELNPELSRNVADWYQKAEHAPEDPKVKKAYRAMVDETKAQWDYLTAHGVKMEPWTKEGQPYANSKEMAADVRDNKHLSFFPTEQGYGTGNESPISHPLLEKTGVKVDGKELVANDLFRAVHDYFGHAKEGYEFGPRGELNAYLSHSAMYSKEARPAMAAETMGQNSWVNFGEHLRNKEGNIPKKGEEGYISPTERPFAEQKATVLPDEMIKQTGAQMSPDLPVDDKELSRYASRIASLTNTKGGASFDLNSGKAPTKGFSVSLYPDRTQLVKSGELTPEQIKAFANKNADLLAQPDHVVGTWDDKESGKTYLDVSYIAPNENVAKQAAEMFNQKAFWDIKGQKEVKTSGSGEPVENMMPAAERVSAAKEAFGKSQELPKGEIRGPVQAALPEGTDNPKGRVRTLQESQHLDLDAIKAAPDTENYRKKVVEQFRTQPGFRDIDASDTNKAIDEIDKRVQNNLQFLYDRATPEDRALWKQWYDFAHSMSHRWGKEYGVHGDVVAAINARLSPQMEWNNNVTLTRRALDTIKKDPTVTQADREFLKAKVTKEDTKENPQTTQSKNLMNKQLEALAGMEVGDKMSELDTLQAGMLMRSHNELYAARSPLHDHNLKRIPGDYLKWSKPFQDLADVVDMYRNPSFENVSNLLGGNHKVRSFYNNHVDPKSPLWTTIDTHATAAANLYPYGGSDKAVISNFGNPNHKNSGINGVYPVYQDAYEKVAKANDVLPRELQSIVWEQMRKELNPAAKRMVQDANKKAVEKNTGQVGPFETIWAKAEKGEITREEAQKQIVAEFEKWNSKANHGAAAKKRAAAEAMQDELPLASEDLERMRQEFDKAKKRGNEPLPERAPPKAEEANPTPKHYPRPPRLPEEPF